MSSVVRLPSGGTIQVRTGVIQGIGPTGPEGKIGPIGPIGPIGEVGPVGPPGQITRIGARCSAPGTQDVPMNSDTDVSFNGATYDDMGIAALPALFTVKEDSDYLVSVWLRLSRPIGTPVGGRRVSVVSGSTVLASITTGAVEGMDTDVQLTSVHRALVGNTFKIVTRHSDTTPLTITDGVIAVHQVGSGPMGPQGIQGVGEQGPIGPEGPRGPTGSGNGPFATYKSVYSS